MRTPGVYIQEVSALGRSVMAVPTSIPAFIGYTRNTSFEGKSLLNRAVRITSLSDFDSKFGGDFPATEFNFRKEADSPDYTDGSSQGYKLEVSGMFFRMAAAMKFFYANGGSESYVISVGDYSSNFDKNHFINAIDLLMDEPDPSLLVIPEAIISDVQSAYDIQNHMIMHCGTSKNKFAILDVPEGYNDLSQSPNCIEHFRNGVGGIIPEYNSYAAAYYPWLNSSIYQILDISFKNISEDFYDTLANIIEDELAAGGVTLNETQTQLLSCFRNKGASHNRNFNLEQADATFRTSSAEYQKILGAIQGKLNLIPPSSAMAGIYTTVDNTEGVWRAPANVAVQAVVKPAISIDHETQEDLNVPLSGKSVCAIRAFKGMGNMVWGARTLDGNSNDWRYVNVRRTLIFLEQSIKAAAKAYVFAPNDANTWTSVRGMISSFLTDIWKQGGLVGPKPADAFAVNVGLGSTMTAEDILAGIMIVSVKVAVSHPAEFIEITFQQQQQKA